MKKPVLAILGIAALGVGTFATTYMQVVTKNGDKVFYPVDDVSEVNFIENAIIPQDTISVPQDTIPAPQDTTPVSEHEYVDLGLPSGTLWAIYNVRDKTSHGEGGFFAWGETSSKEDFYRDSYKWYDENGNMTKYSPTVDSLTTLLPEDDAATVHWGSEWRIPTVEEYQELIAYCKYQKSGYTSEFIGPNGNRLEFFASGIMADNRHLFFEKEGRCQTSSINGTDVKSFFFWDDGACIFESYVHDGLTVRAVRVKKAEHTLYTVNFYTSDSILIESKKVVEGTSVVKEVEVPEKEGYEFIAWSDSLKSISSDLSVYPIYNKIDESDLPYHKYVDLGLPSGTLWATYNIGASSPREDGDYFAWGETETKYTYNWRTYKWGTSKYNERYGSWELDSLTKYNTGKKYPGVIDSLTTLLPEDDAATANWGENWRIPTIDEIKELMNECSHKVTDSGVTFIGPNGNTIYFPSLKDSNIGRYMSSSLDDYDDANELQLFFAGYVESKNRERCQGYPVRAVRVHKAGQITYSVKFYTSDSILIKVQKVVEGSSAKEVEAPAKDGYEFVGWSVPTDSVVSDLSVYALYKEIIREHEYVDLGLPSGTLWATYNIGASRPEELGDYFAWGETEPNKSEAWSSYKWCTTKYYEPRDSWELDSLTKYNKGEKHPGVIDSLVTLLPEDDAATANWGENWRMPTIVEMEELMDNCRHNLTDYGVTFIGPNGNSIFFPYLPNYTAGRYLTSSLYAYDDAYEYLLFFSDYIEWKISERRYGYPVRAVRAKK